MISTESRILDNGTSGLMSGGEETRLGTGLRHRRAAKAAGNSNSLVLSQARLPSTLLQTSFDSPRNASMLSAILLARYWRRSFFVLRIDFWPIRKPFWNAGLLSPQGHKRLVSASCWARSDRSNAAQRSPSPEHCGTLSNNVWYIGNANDGKSPARSGLSPNRTPVLLPWLITVASWNK